MANMTSPDRQTDGDPIPRSALWCIAAAMTLGFLFCDFLLPSFLVAVSDNNVVVAGLLFGTCVAQINLIATASVLVVGHVLFRLAGALVPLTLIWYALILGNRILVDEAYLFLSVRWGRKEVVELAGYLVVGLLASQGVMWVVGRTQRWRLIADSSVADATPQERARPGVAERQFHLRHLLWGMLIVSLLLSAGRLILPQHGVWTNAAVDGTVLVLALAVIACNLCVTIPCIWIAFLARRSIAAIAIAWGIYIVIATGFQFAALCALLGQPGTPVRAFMFFLVSNFTQCVAVAVPLKLFHFLGIDLRKV